MPKNTSSQVDLLLDGLRKDGHRITNARRCILSGFVELSRPLTALELGAYLTKNLLDVNKTTIYRELEFLIDQKIIVEIDLLEGMKRYELASHDSHHHHLVCTECQQIQCVEMPGDLHELEKKIGRQHNFEVTSHLLEFFGKCGECSSKR